MSANSRKEWLAKVETLKTILVTRATSTFGDDDEYRLLRNELLNNAHLKPTLPRFLHSCRNLTEFWSFIQPKFRTYAERREYLRQQFDPILTLLEAPAGFPGDDAVAVALTNVDWEHVQTAWHKALERRQADPDGAITAARTLLEAVCKHILDERGTAYDEKADLPKLYREVAMQLHLSPSQHSEDVFKRILGGCQTIVEGLGSLRNRLSDAHGRGKVGVKPGARHAELAVNLAGTMATFLIATWEAQKSGLTYSSTPVEGESS